jgi:hypothetical protein
MTRKTYVRLPDTVSAQDQHNTDPEYAAQLIRLIKSHGLNDEQIASRTGLHVRSIYRAIEYGFVKFPVQCVFELLAGRR